MATEGLTIDAGQLAALKAQLSPQRFASLKADLLGRVVFTVERAVKLNTPVVTGTLRRSITGEVERVDRGVVGSNLIYAPIVHRKKPYLEWGLDEAEPAIEQLLEQIGNEFVKG